MKYFYMCFLLLLISFQVFAEKIQSQIDSLDIGQIGQTHLVKLTNGRVAFIEFEEKSLLEQILQSYHRGDWLELTLGKFSALESIQIISPRRSLPAMKENIEGPYLPSVVSLISAANIFRKMRRDYKSDSQCFNRAHIWTYDEYVRSKTNLNKVFLFFTTRYIRNHRFHWWFHVTPMVYVGGSNQSNWKMLDRRYTSGPLSPKTWTDIFLSTNRACKIVSKFSEYHENQLTQDCYLIAASMYYVVPSDLDRLETRGVERTMFEADDVEYARWEAFKP